MFRFSFILLAVAITLITTTATATALPTPSLDPPILSSLSPRPVNADANTNPDLATISLSAHFGPWAHTASWALIIYSFASFLALLLLWCLGFVDSGLNPTPRAFGLRIPGNAWPPTPTHGHGHNHRHGTWYAHLQWPSTPILSPGRGGRVVPLPEYQQARLNAELRRWGII